MVSRRRSINLFSSLTDSEIVSSSSMKGGVKDGFRISTFEANISTSPEGKFLLIVPSGLNLTLQVTCKTYSLRIDSPALNASGVSGSMTI